MPLKLIKKIINNLFEFSGYSFSKINTLETQIKQNFYKWLQDFGINTVIDVGANTGQFCTMINKILPQAKIFCFEPIKKCFYELQINTKSFSNATLFNYALGEKESEEYINLNDFTPSSSIFEMEELCTKSFPFTHNSKKEKILVKTLDSLIDIITLMSKVLLKIDVQGYEMNVLKGAEKTLQLCDIIIIEVSFFRLYKAQPLFDDIYKYLTDKNFIYCGNFEQICEPATNKILQADAIFIRNN